MHLLTIIALFISSFSLQCQDFLTIKKEISLGNTFEAEKILYKQNEALSKNWYLALIHFIHDNSLRAHESYNAILSLDSSYFSQICPLIVINERDLDNEELGNLWKKCKMTLPKEVKTEWMDALILEKINLKTASQKELPSLIHIATSLGKNKNLKSYNLKKSKELINAYNIYYFRTKQFERIDLNDTNSLNNLFIIVSWAIQLQKYDEARTILQAISRIKEYSGQAEKLKALLPKTIHPKKSIALEDVLITDYLQEEKDFLLQERIRFLDKQLK